MPFGDTAWLSVKYYYTCSVIKSINLLIYFPETCEIIFRKIFSHLSSIRIWATASLHLAHNKNSTVRFYDNNRYDTFSLNWHTVASIKGVRVAEHFTSDGAAVRVTSSNTSLADPPNLRVSTLIQASRLEWDMTFRPRDQSSLLEVEGPNSIMSAVTSEREPRNNQSRAFLSESEPPCRQTLQWRCGAPPCGSNSVQPNLRPNQQKLTEQTKWLLKMEALPCTPNQWCLIQ